MCFKISANISFILRKADLYISLNVLYDSALLYRKNSIRFFSKTYIGNRDFETSQCKSALPAPNPSASIAFALKFSKTNCIASEMPCLRPLKQVAFPFLQTFKEGPKQMHFLWGSLCSHSVRKCAKKTCNFSVDSQSLEKVIVKWLFDNKKLNWDHREKC